jgi:hypothetical protein
MTDTDLQLLVDFRHDVAEPDEATARRVYALATASTASRPRRQLRLVLAVAAAALVVVPTAVAFGGKIVDLFEGTPAPPEVSTTFTEFNRMADLSTRQGFAAKWPQSDVSKAHGVIEIETADGPEELWAAPSDRGGNCYFVDFANDPPSPSGKSGFGGCDPSPPPVSSVNWGDVWTAQHPSLMTIWGSVFVDAARVRISFDDGSTLELPIVERLFLGSSPKGAKVEKLTAFDAAGNQVAEWAASPH